MAKRMCSFLFKQLFGEIYCLYTDIENWIQHKWDTSSWYKYSIGSKNATYNFTENGGIGR